MPLQLGDLRESRYVAIFFLFLRNIAIFFLPFFLYNIFIGFFPCINCVGEAIFFILFITTPQTPAAFPDLNTIETMLYRFTISSHVTKATIVTVLDLYFTFFVLQDA